MKKSGYKRALWLKQTYESDHVSVIIRDGTLAECPYEKGMFSILQEYNDCALMAEVIDVMEKDYASLSEDEWLNAGYENGAKEGIELAQGVDISLDSRVCVLTINPYSLVIKRKQVIYGYGV